MPDERPNILLITSDQHRADSLGCAGHPCVRTPHLDQLAYEGTRFDRAYIDCPVCIPARTTLITGIKSSTYGCSHYGADFRIARAREKFMGSLMTVAGYQTGLIGKRHWHTEPSFRAGFETVIPIERCKRAQNLNAARDGGLCGYGANELHPTLSRVPPELYSTVGVVARGLYFLRERERAQPFFLWLSFVDPHPPFAIHEPYFSLFDQSPIPEAVHGDWSSAQDVPIQLLEHRLYYNPKPMGKDELRKARGVYYGMITNLDEQLGRIFATLINQKEWENTLVVYTSDHGEMLGDHDDIAKSSFLNAASNIPLIIRPPKGWNCPTGQVSNALVEWADFLPTLGRVARADLPGDLDGVDFLPVVRGESEAVKDEFFGVVDRQFCIHDGRHKYLYFPADGMELCFAADDRHDRHNLLPNEELAAPLRARLIRRLEALGHPDLKDGKLVNENRPRPDLNRLKAANCYGWCAAGRSLNFSGGV